MKQRICFLLAALLLCATGLMIPAGAAEISGETWSTAPSAASTEETRDPLPAAETTEETSPRTEEETETGDPAGEEPIFPIYKRREEDRHGNMRPPLVSPTTVTHCP